MCEHKWKYMPNKSNIEYDSDPLIYYGVDYFYCFYCLKYKKLRVTEYKKDKESKIVNARDLRDYVE